jgi:hexosaminidase
MEVKMGISIRFGNGFDVKRAGHRWVWAVLLSLVPLYPAHGETLRRTLLPIPQKIQYGKDMVPLRGFAIVLPADSLPEDQFAAEELSRALSARAQSRFPISGGMPPARTIALVRSGPVDPLPIPGEQTGPESREAYKLTIARDRIVIRARSSAGLYYGVQTIAQMIEGHADQAALPEAEIQDWPSLAYRGTMVDMSHGPLPTVEEVERQLDLLARFKGNQYYFYNEASVELDGYRLVNPNGRFTQEQVRRIIAYARERHIDVVPCLELYGHLHDLFRLERFSDLAVFPHAGEFNPTNPKVKELLANWVEQFSRIFPSPFVHVGFDETWQIGNLAKQGQLTPAKLFVEQLRNVATLFQQRGKHVMAWADVMIHYPEIIADMPPGIIAIPWTYEPEKTYQPFLEPLDKNHIPYVVATGVHCFDEIATDLDLTYANIDAFLKAGRQAKALGVINTVWTDEAQVLLRQAWPGMAYGAVAAWQTGPVDQTKFLDTYAGMMYCCAAPQIAQALQKLNRAENYLQKALGQQTIQALWQEPLNPAVLKSLEPHRENLRQIRLLAEDAIDQLDEAMLLGADPLTLKSFLVGARLLDYAGMKFLYALEIPERWKALGPRPDSNQWWNEFEAEVIEQNHGRIIDLMEIIGDLREDYRAAWLSEYTPYRLATALGRWEGEFHYWRAMQEKLRAFSRTRKDGDPLPPLQEVIR